MGKMKDALVKLAKKITGKEEINKDSISNVLGEIADGYQQPHLYRYYFHALDTDENKDYYLELLIAKDLENTAAIINYLKTNSHNLYGSICENSANESITIYELVVHEDDDEVYVLTINAMSEDYYFDISTMNQFIKHQIF